MWAISTVCFDGCEQVAIPVVPEMQIWGELPAASALPHVPGWRKSTASCQAAEGRSAPLLVAD